MTAVTGIVQTGTGKLLRGMHVSNGECTIVTDGKGRFELQVDPEVHPFIFVTRKNNFAHTGWYASTRGSGHSLELVVQLPCPPPRPSRTLRIGHISDTHVDRRYGESTTAAMLARDLHEIQACDGELEFIVATGDLTDRGDLASLKALRRTLIRSPIPVIPMFGGHDGNDERRRLKTPLPHIRHWERVMGPTYFSINLGHWHLIVCPCEDAFFGPERAAVKRRWLETELARAAGSRIILAQHTAPGNDLLEFLAGRGVELVLFGHWHSSKCYKHAGVLVLGTPTPAFGGIDTMPRGFRKVELSPRRLRTAYRPLMNRARRRPKSTGDLKEVWKVTAGTSLSRGQVTIADNSVFIPLADEDNRGRAGVLALHLATGRKKWLVPTAHSVRGSVALAEGLLAAVTQTGEVIVMNAETGRTIWTNALKGFPERWIYSGPAIVNGLVIAGTGGGGIEAFDLKTGSQQWTWTHPKGTSDKWPSYTSPLPVGNNVAIMVHRVGVSCLTAKTARTRWHFRAYYGYMFAPMTLEGRKLFVPDRGRFHAVDCLTGRRLWTRRVDPGEIISWACDPDLLVLNTSGRLTTGLAQARTVSSGRLIWQLRYGKDLADMVPYCRNTASALAMPLLTEHTVYLSGLDGRIRAVDRNDGRILSLYDTAEPIVSAALYGTEALIVATYTGSIIRLHRGFV